MEGELTAHLLIADEDGCSFSTNKTMNTEWKESTRTLDTNFQALLACKEVLIVTSKDFLVDESRSSDLL